MNKPTSPARFSTMLLAAIAAALVSRDALADPILEQRCNDDSLTTAQARIRLNWMRRCAFKEHIQNPQVPFPDGRSKTISFGFGWTDYKETYDSNGTNAYSGQYTGNQALVNQTMFKNLYKTDGLFSITESDMTINGFIYKIWSVPSTYDLSRPTYPTYSNSNNIIGSSLLLPPQNLSDATEDCHLYDANGHQWNSNFYVVGWCTSSCYTPEQQVLFPDGYNEIAHAVTAMKPTMVTLTEDSTLDDIQFRRNPVLSYTSELRDTTHIIFNVRTASGGTLRVTNEHPVILSNGRVVQAKSLKRGDHLLQQDGTPDVIVSIHTESHYGKVYNLKPDSMARVSNILVAQGYLVGSSVYQNEEIDYINRIILSRSISDEVMPD